MKSGKKMCRLVMTFIILILSVVPVKVFATTIKPQQEMLAVGGEVSTKRSCNGKEGLEITAMYIENEFKKNLFYSMAPVAKGLAKVESKQYDVNLVEERRPKEPMIPHEIIVEPATSQRIEELGSGEIKIVKIDKETNERLEGIKLEIIYSSDSFLDRINCKEVINKIQRLRVIQYCKRYRKHVYSELIRSIDYILQNWLYICNY